jgi:hypothetical protein
MLMGGVTTKFCFEPLHDVSEDKISFAKPSDNCFLQPFEVVRRSATSSVSGLSSRLCTIGIHSFVGSSGRGSRILTVPLATAFFRSTSYFELANGAYIGAYAQAQRRNCRDLAHIFSHYICI